MSRITTRVNEVGGGPIKQLQDLFRPDGQYEIFMLYGSGSDNRISYEVHSQFPGLDNAATNKLLVEMFQSICAAANVDVASHDSSDFVFANNLNEATLARIQEQTKILMEKIEAAGLSEVFKNPRATPDELASAYRVLNNHLGGMQAAAAAADASAVDRRVEREVATGGLVAATPVANAGHPRHRRDEGVSVPRTMRSPAFTAAAGTPNTVVAAHARDGSYSARVSGQQDVLIKHFVQHTQAYTRPDSKEPTNVTPGEFGRQHLSRASATHTYEKRRDGSVVFTFPDNSRECANFLFRLHKKGQLKIAPGVELPAEIKRDLDAFIETDRGLAARRPAEPPPPPPIARGPQ